MHIEAISASGQLSEHIEVIPHQNLPTDLFRFSTAGNVDDGKSTLIGRLLLDTQSVLQDQLEELERVSRTRGDGRINLALLTDGLRAEREQNITIDVAYRFFASSKRRFIVADTPGHQQYTRNMVTGASTADLAIVLIDARKGLQVQSKRHAFISSLLRTPHIVVAINKMDLVGYSENAFGSIVGAFRRFAAHLEIDSLSFVPISALNGDNVVHRSVLMPWYDGPTLLQQLEDAPGSVRSLVGFRLPVQCVLRPHQDFRGLAGQVASGMVARGDEVIVLPAGHKTSVKNVLNADGDSVSAYTGDSIVLTLEDEIDVGRGDTIVSATSLPLVGSRIDAVVCWMDESPMDCQTEYLVMHTTRTVQAHVNRIMFRFDIDALTQEPATTLNLNEIGRIELTTTQPLSFDTYRQNRVTGSFILIDPSTYGTVAAGMIYGTVDEKTEIAADPGDEQAVSPVLSVPGERRNLTRDQRLLRNEKRATVIWLTGLPASGKSTIAKHLDEVLSERGCSTVLLDGDELRKGLCADLDFSEAGRTENIRRVAHTARLFFEQGFIVICAFVSPLRKDRHFVRSLFPATRFVEVFVDCDINECIRRDPKGHYARAIAGAIPDFTGISSAYEVPTSAELTVNTAVCAPTEAAEQVVAMMQSMGVLRRNIGAGVIDVSAT